MRLSKRGVKRTADEKVERRKMNNVIEGISLRFVSIEERRKEAEKPLYLVRYE